MRYWMPDAGYGIMKNLLSRIMNLALTHTSTLLLLQIQLPRNPIFVGNPPEFFAEAVRSQRHHCMPAFGKLFIQAIYFSFIFTVDKNRNSRIKTEIMCR